MGSNFLDRNYWTQVLDQDTLRFSLCSYTNKLKGLVESFRSSTRTKRRSCLTLPKACWWYSVNKLSCPSLVVLYQGFNSSSKLEFISGKSLPYLGTLTCLAMVGVVILSTFSFHVSKSHLFRMGPRYITYCLQVWTFLTKTWHPMSPRYHNSNSVPVKQISPFLTVNRRSPTCCNKQISDGGRILNPCGNWVQVSWLLTPISGSKVKYGCLLGAKDRLKKRYLLNPG